jgi:protein-disulfide isomerase
VNRSTRIGAGAVLLATLTAPGGPGVTRAHPAQESDPLLEQRSKGNPAAPVTVYEVSDFQCPYCRTFTEETLPTIDREYIQTGKARLVFVNLPLVQLHANAAAAHEFAMCAARQNLFWPVHDLLFRHQESWASLDDPRPYFMTLGDSTSMDRDRLASCFETGEVRWIVQQEAMAVAQQGITSTPSFVIADGLLSGLQSLDVWRSILDSLFAERSPRN